MFSERVLSHFREPHNAGEATDASHIGEVTNPVCGDVLRLTARVENGTIVAACFKAQGCVPSIAAASAMTDMLVGKTLTDARRIVPAEIALALDGLPEASTHAAELCCDAIAALRPIR
ncbi:MAG: iron-sulfur cluster assembly scaffold protein [Candidatus Acidiferrales bacterium]